MQRRRNTFKIAAVGLMLIAALVFEAACGVGGAEIKQLPQKPTPTPTEREISGVFNVSGAAANEQDQYGGVLTVTPQGDVYSFRWQTNKGTRVGPGIQLGDAVAASFASPGGGKGCGVVVYKITADGNMMGRTAR